MKVLLHNSGFAKLFTLVTVSVTVLVLVMTFVIFKSKTAEKQPVEHVVSVMKECSQTPQISSPVMAEEIKSLTYPGQARDGVYYPESVLTVKSPVNEVSVKLPIAAKLIEGRRYIEQGEEQFALVFETECNIRLRYDHLAVLSPSLAELVSGLKVSTEMQPLTKDIPKDEVVATRVGIFKNNTAIMGFGMYDYNQKNKPSSNSEWLVDPLHHTEDAQHGVCWLDNLVMSDRTIIDKLLNTKADSPRTSDYCTI